MHELIQLFLRYPVLVLPSTWVAPQETWEWGVA